jgi:AraC-like DNA-binding protein/quercetin dioxygenase-like cupin family protein
LISEANILSQLIADNLLPPPISTLQTSVFPPGWKFPHHTYQDEVEILYVYSGASYVGINRQFIRIKKNDCLIIFPQVTHNYFLRENESCKMFDLVFKTADLSVFNPQELRRNLRFLSELILLQIEYMKFVDSGEIRTILEHILDQRETASSFSRMLSKLYFCELFVSLSKIISETRDELGKLKNQHVTTGLDYLVNSYSTDLSVEEIARHVGLSPRHFSRLFTQELGMNVQEYLAIYRIKKAKEMLTNSDMDITQIAYSLGFNSSQYFTTCFKRIEHITPKIFRQTARPENRL